MTEEEKTKYQKTAAYVVWQLEKWLPEAIKEAEKFRDTLPGSIPTKENATPHNLVSVQIMSWKSVLNRISDLKKEYQSKPSA